MLRKRPAKSLFRSLRYLAAPLLVTSMVALDVTSIALSQERAAPTDSWTDSAGAKTIKADFVKLDGVNLTIRMADGTEKVVPLSKLDDKSRLKAREMAKSVSKPSASAPATAKSTPTAGTKVNVPVVFPSSPSAQEFMDIIVKEMTNDNPMVVWDALPASKQKQIQEVVKLATTRIEQKTLTAIKKFRGELLTALKSKKQFILNSTQIPIPPDQKSVLKGSYDSLVALIEAYLPEELMDVSYLQQTEIRDLLSVYIGKITDKAKELDDTLPINSPMKKANQVLPTAKVENATAKDAMITLEIPSQIPGQSVPPMKFVATEGRWLPESLLGAWDQGIDQVKAVLQSANPKDIHKGVTGALAAANFAMGTISTAETQEDFDDAIGQVIGMVGGMMGGAMPNQR